MCRRDINDFNVELEQHSTAQKNLKHAASFRSNKPR